MAESEGVTRKIQAPPAMKASHIPSSKQRPHPTDHGGMKKLGTFHAGGAKAGSAKSGKAC